MQFAAFRLLRLYKLLSNGNRAAVIGLETLKQYGYSLRNLCTQRKVSRFVLRARGTEVTVHALLTIIQLQASATFTRGILPSSTSLVAYPLWKFCRKRKDWELAIVVTRISPYAGRLRFEFCSGNRFFPLGFCGIQWPIQGTTKIIIKNSSRLMSHKLYIYPSQINFHNNNNNLIMFLKLLYNLCSWYWLNGWLNQTKLYIAEFFLRSW
jgi:hypothetical protein